jgi:dienelactone hydrolase
MAADIRRDVTFRSDDADIGAWLYEPAGSDPSGDSTRPAVVLGHGLGAIKEMGLEAYAQRFTEAGYVALAFDYRHFGASGGRPRQLLDIGRQLQDWASAVAYVRGLPAVDSGRVALFGTSFGGGHVIVTAARDPQVAAVIAQCPFTSGSASARTIDLRGLRGVLARAARDEVAARRGREPVLVQAAGPPGTPAMMNAPDALPGYLGLVPDDVEFTNAVAARVANRVVLHHPGRQARRVRCPILFQVCEHDSVAPPGPTLRYAARAPRGEVLRYPVGHFDVYRGEPLQRALADDVDFLRRHLPPP